MMNLLMRDDKSLRITNIRPIYQYDSLMDALRVLVPKYYESQDLSEFRVLLTYYLPDDTTGSMDLTLDDEPYNEDYISYTFDLTPDLTSIVGTVFLKLTFTKVIDETTYMLDTQPAPLPISSPLGVSGDIDPSDLARVEGQIAEINRRLNVEAAKIANIDENGLKIVL